MVISDNEVQIVVMLGANLINMYIPGNVSNHFSPFSVKTDLQPGGAISRLYIADANRFDLGNYTCSLADIAQATVFVHVLNGRYIIKRRDYCSIFIFFAMNELHSCLLITHLSSACRCQTHRALCDRAGMQCEQCGVTGAFVCKLCPFVSDFLPELIPECDESHLAFKKHTRCIYVFSDLF